MNDEDRELIYLLSEEGQMARAIVAWILWACMIGVIVFVFWIFGLVGDRAREGKYEYKYSDGTTKSIVLPPNNSSK